MKHALVLCVLLASSFNLVAEEPLEVDLETKEPLIAANELDFDDLDAFVLEIEANFDKNS